MRFILRMAWTLVGALCAPLVLAQQEKPLPPEGLDRSSELSLFGDNPERRLVINGFAVGEYTYDFNTDRNSFGDSALAIALSKVFSDHFSAFAQLTAAREPESPFLSAEKVSSDIKTDIDNLQVTWIPSARSGLSVTLGKFDSPLAIERDDAPLNFEATRSFTFQFARPVKFTGLELHEAFSPQLEAWAILANGWDVDKDNNKAKTVAVYGLWNPSLAAHLGLGVIHGAEKDDRTGDPRTTGVATLLLQPTQRWVLGGEAVAGRESNASANEPASKWYAAALFTHHRFGKHWAVTLRGDWMDDVDGSRTGQRQVLRSLTFSPQFLLGGGFYGVFRYLDRTSLRLPELAVRIDMRYDRSTEPVFVSRGAVGRRDHFSGTLQTVVLF